MNPMLIALVGVLSFARPPRWEPISDAGAGLGPKRAPVELREFDGQESSEQVVLRSLDEAEIAEIVDALLAENPPDFRGRSATWNRALARLDSDSSLIFLRTQTARLQHHFEELIQLGSEECSEAIEVYNGSSYASGILEDRKEAESLRAEVRRSVAERSEGEGPIDGTHKYLGTRIRELANFNGFPWLARNILSNSPSRFQCCVSGAENLDWCLRVARWRVENDPRVASELRAIAEPMNFRDEVRSILFRDSFERLCLSFDSKRDAKLMRKNLDVAERLELDEQDCWIELVQLRVAVGVRALILDEKLNALARMHAGDMSAHQFVAHESPVEGHESLKDRAKAARTKASAECIAFIEPDEESFVGVAAYDHWWVSREDAPNLMHKSWRRVGVGIVDGYCVLVFQ